MLAPPPGPEIHEIVHRPEPGLARGLFEGRPWMLVAVAAIALIGGALYAAFRSGRFGARRPRK